jgi:serine/threonine protein kinase
MFTGKLPFPADTVQESMILRLTDSPKRLGEMKSDVAWPAEVQAVMDKALERDVNQRYQTASEFGRALHKAISSMPEATATNAFTSVMGRMSTPKKPAASVPPSLNASGGMTRPMPSTRVNKSTPAAEPPTIIRQEKNKAPLFGGIAAGIAALAVAGYFVLNMNKNASADGNVDPQGQTPSAPIAINLSRELERLPPTDSTPELARDALVKLAAFDSVAQLATTPDSTFLHFRHVRARALLMSGNEKAGCDSLAMLEGKLKSSGSRFFRSDSALLVNVCGK